MKPLALDVMAVGNHGILTMPLKSWRFVDALSCPVISGNLDLSSSNLLNGKWATMYVALKSVASVSGIISALASIRLRRRAGRMSCSKDEIDSLVRMLRPLTQNGRGPRSSR